MDNIRFVLVIFFVFLSYMIWEQWQVDYGPKPNPPQSQTAAGKSGTPGASASSTGAVAPSMTGASEQGLTQSRRIKVKTDVLDVEIDTAGGDIRIVQLPLYPQDKNTPDKPVRLLSDNPAELFISQSGILAAGDSGPTHHSVWQAEAEQYQLQPGQDTIRVPLSWTSPQGIQVTKTYVFHPGSYVVEMEHKIVNGSASNWSGRQYTQLQRLKPEKKPGSALSTSQADRAYVGGVLHTPEEVYQKVEFDDMADKDLNVTSKSGWVAMIQHYFMAAWIPPAEDDTTYYTKALPESRFLIGAQTPQIDLAPGTEHVFKARLFAGPKLQRTLEATAPGLELTVDYGSLTIIAKPIFWLLEKFHSLFMNWGWAVIFVTLTIKLLFFKLSASSYKSMANMRKLQPKLQKLKEQHGDDKQKFNMAMMELYRKEKVNPLGGCLPILVQIPVFISLYWVLVESVELRQAPFLLWLNDMSSHDPYFVLPVVMGISMFIQQKLNPPPQDPIQAKIMKFFPLMFTFFFVFFPSGLVLYWVVNNVLSIIQQWYITRQIERAA